MGRNIHVACIVVCISLLGCASVFLQTDDFPDKLKQGCDSLDSCEHLETEAKARVERCQENTIGYIRCSDANADLTVASSYAEKWREKVQRDQQELAERERKKEQALQVAEQQRREHLRESAELAAQEQRENERRSREAQVTAAKQAERDKAAEYIRLLGPSGREQRIRTCVKDYGPGNCAEMVMQISDAIGDEKESGKLAKLAEAPPPPPASRARASASSDDAEDDNGDGSLRCCDGMLSPTCTCSGSHQGCCSHHGGVCGCAK
ncbi:MAG TPA: hypothetical protein VH062_35655 [Polyangiaceae bacterium]|jgi:phage-related minor tail protein|nr:hypothetical protein [Polyangiaceae bacterium]